MATYSWAQLDQWADAHDRRVRAVIQQSANDLIVSASKTAPAKARGGTIKPGFIPVDIGTLAASKLSELHGSSMLAGTGEDSHIMAIAGMEPGDVLRVTWGGPAAVYARKVHYSGWLWVETAANRWQAIVAAAVARVVARSGG